MIRSRSKIVSSKRGKKEYCRLRPLVYNIPLWALDDTVEGLPKIGGGGRGSSLARPPPWGAGGLAIPLLLLKQGEEGVAHLPPWLKKGKVVKPCPYSTPFPQCGVGGLVMAPDHGPNVGRKDAARAMPIPHSTAPEKEEEQ